MAMSGDGTAKTQHTDGKHTQGGGGVSVAAAGGTVSRDREPAPNGQAGAPDRSETA
jgi:hypothetical protein